MEINGRLQEFAGRLLPDEESAGPEELEAFVRTLPHAANAAETSLLKAKLLDVVFRWSVYAHTRFHGTHRCPCPFTTLESLARSWKVDPEWDDAVTVEWASACAGVGERLRAREEARRLAAVLVERYQDARAVGTHADDLSAEPWTLARAFRDEFGCTPHAYLTRIRVAKAVPMLADGDKSEWVASSVGYRSRKDLSGAVKKLTGLMPSEVQRLSARQVASIVERLDPGRN